MNTWLRQLLIPAFAIALILPAVTAADKPAPKDAKKEEPKKEEVKPAGKDPKDMNADEAEEAGLCPVTKKQSKPVYHFEYKGKEYHFATRDAQKEFAGNPEKFGAKGAAPAAKK
jgi:YHS domain-containing protein